MNCQSYEEMIVLSTLDELSKEDAEQLDIHLQTCAHCQSLRQSYQMIEQSMVEETRSDISDVERLELENQIYRRVILEQQSQRHVSRINRYGLPVAAAIAIFCLGLGFGGYIDLFDSSKPVLTSVSQQSRSTIFKSRSYGQFRFSASGMKVIAKGKSAVAGYTQ